MNREIKFRAWEKEEMHYFNLFDNEGDYIRTKEGKDVFLWDDKIMQYTGLKDKNGKEIYEGDVLGMRERGMRYKKKEDYSIFLVEYNQDQGMFGYRSHNERKSQSELWYGFTCRRGGNCASISYFSKPIILGNIYENPGLIKKQ